jgi:tetratricopeptide (TPR) repeat protein
MTPVRTVGLVLLAFVASWPVFSALQSGVPACLSWSSEAEAEEDDPLVDVLCLKGLQAMSNGQTQKAIDVYTQAIKRDPKYSYAYMGRGDAYLADGNLDAAISDYEQAFRLDPENDSARTRAELARQERSSR